MKHQVLPSMIARKSGNIVNIGSAAGLMGDYLLPIYSTAKAAMHGFTKVLAKDVGQHNIRVNAVAPNGTLAADPEAFNSGSRFQGNFFARLFAGTKPEDAGKRARQTVIERPMATPEEVASLVVWLASGNAGFATGQVYPMDGRSLL